ncbi:TIGR04454 family lipoprotein [Leptospira perolatii]|uniref:TIGR04454 family lipoprotein n=1 Tax=Leptospira perolatii TaxID=2023191 RepID=A0A2M9ZP89_9LEPT|nr:TIGR04454 family lipoprotein [Leptospira perolatii]PJZ70692.1 TIGR04454 family lipoprotein [Leptospira perolatii]PJZ73902.1 TIGR04454 family lipoprotein [Leptospira perolatii]
MKKLSFAILPALALFVMVSCGGAKVSQAECEPVVNDLFQNLTQGKSPEETEKLNSLKPSLAPMLLKECMSGKYDLSCLKSAKDIQALAVCKK